MEAEQESTKVAIFRQTQQISDKIPTERCKFLAEKKLGNKNFALKFHQKGFFGSKCTKIFEEQDFPPIF